MMTRDTYNYDVWFDCIRLEEDNAVAGDDDDDGLDKVREVYERAIANVPLVMEKRYWKRYCSTVDG